jgi:hypothetical protein
MLIYSAAVALFLYVGFADDLARARDPDCALLRDVRPRWFDCIKDLRKNGGE